MPDHKRWEQLERLREEADRFDYDFRKLTFAAGADPDGACASHLRCGEAVREVKRLAAEAREAEERAEEAVAALRRIAERRCQRDPEDPPCATSIKPCRSCQARSALDELEATRWPTRSSS